MLLNFGIAGNVYYLNQFRNSIFPSSDKQPFNIIFNKGILRSKILLDILCFTAYYGTIMAFLLMFVILVLPNDLLAVELGIILFKIEFGLLLFTIQFGLIVLTILPHFLFYHLLLIDCTNRTKREWEELNYLKYINPWSWIFGLRKYYLNVLRDEL